MSGDAPEFHAYPIHPAYADRARFRPVWGYGIAAIALVGLVCVLNVVTLLGIWHAYSLVMSAVDGTGASAEDLLMATSALQVSAILDVVGLIVAGAVFLMWVYRVRVNAELFGGVRSQRHGRGWSVGGFLCPVVNLWFPPRIMADVYRASARRPVRVVLVWCWWTALLLDVAAMLVVAPLVGRDGNPADEVHGDAVAMTVGLVFQVTAAAFIAVIIARISGWQNDPRPVDPTPVSADDFPAADN